MALSLIVQPHSTLQCATCIWSSPNEDNTKSFRQVLLVEHGTNTEPVLCWSELKLGQPGNLCTKALVKVQPQFQ